VLVQKAAAAELLVAALVFVGGRSGRNRGREKEESKGREVHRLFGLIETVLD
jgi:hypothetical protein